MMLAQNSTRVTVRLLILVLVALAGCDEDSPTAPKVEKLSTITNFRLVGVAARSVALEWIALGDTRGYVYYDIYQLDGLAPTNEDALRAPVASLGRAGNAGGTMGHTFTELSDDSRYIFAIRARMADAQTSDWSEVVSARTPRLVLDFYSHMWSPALSPTGNQLAFTLDHEIWVQVLGTSRIWRIGRGEFSSWSPDGSEIVIARSYSWSWELFIYPVVGGSPLELARSSDSPGVPSWSPDGDYIAYSQGTELIVVDPVRLTENSFETNASADHWSWAPDSVQLVSGRSGYLSIADLSDGTVELFRLVGIDTRVQSAAWSPVDDWVLFVIDRAPPKGGIWAVHLADGALVHLTADGRTPVWYPDGQWMLFEQDGNIWSMEIRERLRSEEADAR